RPQALPIKRREGCGVVPLPQLDLLQIPRAIYHETMVGFREIMIIPGDPKDRHHRLSRDSLCCPRALRGRQRLVEGETRSEEEDGLLAGSDATRAGKETFEILPGRAIGDERRAKPGVDGPHSIARQLLPINFGNGSERCRFELDHAGRSATKMARGL